MKVVPHIIVILILSAFAYGFFWPSGDVVDDFQIDAEILFIERDQYLKDHHNTATLFVTNEINTASFRPGGALKALNTKTGKVRTLFETTEGMVRDPEVSFDGTKIIFSYRKNIAEDYHIWEINADGTNLRQLTSKSGVADIDPLYLPDGDVVFSSTRETKYCMCNRHIMCNLFRMGADGSNPVQLGFSTLFEGHSALLNDGRIIYDRWEYVDRNFGDAQGLWTVYPDGTKHAIYYGNNMNSPGGIIDPRAIPNTNQIVCIFGSCHDRPWGALVVLDRSKGVDGEPSVLKIWPKEGRDMIGKGNWDQFMQLKTRYEDPYPLDESHFLVSRLISKVGDPELKEKMGLYLVDMEGNETLLYEGQKGCYDPMPLTQRPKPQVLPEKRTFEDQPGFFYIQDVYEGTHMEGVEKGAVRYVRIVESPPKRTWTPPAWDGQGQQAPGMNWHSFENKKILGEVPVEEDGSAYFEVPHSKFVFFQLLDEDKKMIQSMRSGTMVQSGETNGCIGCHEDRLSVPVNQNMMPLALRKPPHKMTGWKGEPRTFSFTREVQPIFDKHCVKCHDFGQDAGDKVLLAGDRNPYFNASYIDMHLKKIITSVGGGPSEIQQAYSWGSHPSKLTEVIDATHHDVHLSQDEKERLYTWMDLNAVYYPEYESAYPENHVGRSPLYDDEHKRIEELSGVEFGKLRGHWRTLGPQISFERPDLSPLLKGVDSNEDRQEIIEILQLGYQRMIENPRADMEGFIPHKSHADQLAIYILQREEEKKIRKAILANERVYDEK
jgi:hypothetical protein